MNKTTLLKNVNFNCKQLEFYDFHFWFKHMAHKKVLNITRTANFESDLMQEEK